MYVYACEAEREERHVSVAFSLLTVADRPDT